MKMQKSLVQSSRSSDERPAARTMRSWDGRSWDGGAVVIGEAPSSGAAGAAGSVPMAQRPSAQAFKERIPQCQARWIRGLTREGLGSALGGLRRYALAHIDLTHVPGRDVEAG